MTWLSRKIKEREGTPGFETERLMLELAESIATRMNELRLSQSELARRTGKDRSQITRLLRCNPNVTIRTLVEVACALETRWNIAFAHAGTSSIMVSNLFFDSNIAATSADNIRTTRLHPFVHDFHGAQSGAIEVLQEVPMGRTSQKVIVCPQIERW